MNRLFQIWQHLIELYAEKQSTDVLWLECLSWVVFLPLGLLFYAWLSYFLLYGNPATARRWRKGLMAMWVVVTCMLLLATMVFVARACG